MLIERLIGQCWTVSLNILFSFSYSKKLKYSGYTVLYKLQVYNIVIYNFKRLYSIYELPWWLSGKEFACQSKINGSTLGREDSLEKELATHSSILAWESPRTQEPGRLQSTGLKKRWTPLGDETRTPFIVIIKY